MEKGIDFLTLRQWCERFVRDVENCSEFPFERIDFIAPNELADTVFNMSTTPTSLPSGQRNVWQNYESDN